MTVKLHDKLNSKIKLKTSFFENERGVAFLSSITSITYFAPISHARAHNKQTAHNFLRIID